MTIDRMPPIQYWHRMPKLAEPTPAPLTVYPHPVHGTLPFTKNCGLPKGTVRANPARQNPGMWASRYFYADDPRTCVQCGEDFVFSAREQLHWYEELGFTFDSMAIRCLGCRRLQRGFKWRQRWLAETTAAVRERPHDAQVYLDLAEARVEYYIHCGGNGLDIAIWAARKAVRAEPGLVEGHYWEGRAQELAGRPHKSIEAYQHYCQDADPTDYPYATVLAADARDRVRRLSLHDSSDSGAPQASE